MNFTNFLTLLQVMLYNVASSKLCDHIEIIVIEVLIYAKRNFTNFNKIFKHALRY